MAAAPSSVIRNERTVSAVSPLGSAVVRVDVGVVVLVTHRTLFGIIERPGQEKAFWSRIGVAFKNRDGSINLKLDFFPRDPATGLQVRWAEEEEN